MQQIITDLVAEQDYLDAALAATPDDVWDTPSPADGWLMRDCIAHLAEFDDLAASIAATGAFPEDEQLPREGVRSGRQVKALELSRTELVAWWREARKRLATALAPLDPKARLPWAGPEMGARSFATARLMECWSHGLDALEAAGIEPRDSDRLKHIAHLGFATREFAYRTRELDPPTDKLYVELMAPSGAVWTWGDPENAESRITGSAGDFCRVVTQRIHYADTALQADGPSAAEFLHVAQAFAGPPGQGRPPKSEAG